MGGIGEFQAQFGKAAHDGKTHRLPRRGHGLQFGNGHEEDQLEIQAGRAEPREGGAIEATIGLRVHNRLQMAGQRLQQIGRGLVDNAEIQHHAPFFNAAQIGHLLFQQLGIGHHQLFARQGSDAGGLQPDMLHGAGGGAVTDCVAHPERTVEQDGERGKQIGKNPLGGQADGDAADAQTSHQRGDIHAQVIENQDRRQQPDHDIDQHGDDAHGVAERDGILAAMAGAAMHQAQHQLPDPQGTLHRQCDGEQIIHQPHQRPGEGHGMGGTVQRRRDQEQRERARHQSAQQAGGTGKFTWQQPQRAPFQQPQSDQDGTGNCRAEQGLAAVLRDPGPAFAERAFGAGGSAAHRVRHHKALSNQAGRRTATLASPRNSGLSASSSRRCTMA